MKLLGIIVLILSGIYFSIKLKFKHLNIYKALNVIKRKEDGISSFQSLCISLASRIGVGSLSGVVLSIYIGGVGSIFWMWIITIICSSNTMIESILSIKYRERKDKQYEGGPFYYINKGMNNRLLSIIYAILFLLSYNMFFLSIQSNTISKVITEAININPIIIGIMIALFVSFIIINGIKEIASIVSKLIPFIASIYIITCVIIIIKNITLIPYVIKTIIKSAFNIKSFIVGCTKSIFSTESGLGTGAVACASTSNAEPDEQGYVQVFGVLFDTFIVSTLTAFVVLLKPIHSNIINLNGIELTYKVFLNHLGRFGGLVLIISIILFAFSTIISGYYYGEVALKYIFKDSNAIILKLITIIIIVISTIISPKIIWNLIDIFIVILGIINTLTLIMLRDKVFNDKI